MKSLSLITLLTYDVMVVQGVNGGIVLVVLPVATVPVVIVTATTAVMIVIVLDCLGHVEVMGTPATTTTMAQMIIVNHNHDDHNRFLWRPSLVQWLIDYDNRTIGRHYSLT